MSKKEKKKPSALPEIPDLDKKFLSIIQFTGWISLLIGGALLVLNLYLAFIDENHMITIGDIEIGITRTSVIIMIFSITTTVFCFGVVDLLRRDLSKKKQYFMSWLIGEFLLAIFGVFSLAVYQW